MFALLKRIWLGIDGCVLSTCQKISDEAYEKTGRSNFTLAKIFLHLAFLINTAMLFMIILNIESLTTFGKIMMSLPVLAIYIFINASLSFNKVVGFLTDDSLYDSSEDLKAALMKWKKWYSIYRQTFLGALFLLLSTIALLLKITKSTPNPFSDSLLSYIYLSLLLMPIFSISYYFTSCKTILPIKGKAALMVAG